jgi:hypothetical protein
MRCREETEHICRLCEVRIAAQPLVLLAAASPTSLAVSTSAMGGSGALTGQLLITSEAGRHWSTAATERQRAAHRSASQHGARQTWVRIGHSGPLIAALSQFQPDMAALSAT